MGYPMSWSRVVHRNALSGDYAHAEGDPVEAVRSLIRGDMRRLEQDSRDPLHLWIYARHAGVTEAQAKALLDAFFGDERMQGWTVDEWRALRPKGA